MLVQMGQYDFMQQKLLSVDKDFWNTRGVKIAKCDECSTKQIRNLREILRSGNHKCVLLCGVEFFGKKGKARFLETAVPDLREFVRQGGALKVITPIEPDAWITLRAICRRDDLTASDLEEMLAKLNEDTF